MEKHCTTVYFLIKKSRVDKHGRSPIVCYISVGGSRISYYTGKKIKASDWDERRQMVKEDNQDADLINEYLNQLRYKIFVKEIKLMEKGFAVTATLLKEAVNDKLDALKSKTLLQVFDDYQKLRAPLAGKTISPKTYYCNSLTGIYLKEYITSKLKRKDIYLHEVKIEFIQGFHSFLIGTKNNCQNTCNKHLYFLKNLMKIAVANGYINYSPISTYKVKKVEVEIDYLDYDELLKIINFKSEVQKLERARDAFLFGCFTGLSYIDIRKLRKEHLETDGDGRIWIMKKRQKTGILSRIPLLPMAKYLLDKYQDWPGEMIFPIQDCTDVNECLKDIARLCGISKHVTFHTSRHTFASTVTLANNISMEVIAKMMGHSNTRMTSRYAKLVDKTIAEQMDKISNIFSPEGDNG